MREITGRIRLTTINDFGVRICFVYSFDEWSQKSAVLLGISPGVPVTDVLLVPQCPIVNAIAEMVYHPRDIAVECRDLLRGSGSIEDGVQAAIIVVERAWRGGLRRAASRSAKCT
jgi:hypothetical protein